MKNKVQLIAYADRLGDGTLSSMTDIVRTRFDGVYDGVHILPFFTPLQALTRSTTPKSTRVSAAGTTSLNFPRPTASWSMPSSTT